MTKREQRAIEAFSSRSGLPAWAYTIFPFQHACHRHLRVWIDHSFLHAIDGLPKMVNGIEISVEPMPKAHTYMH